jgi:hypothetical protein
MERIIDKIIITIGCIAVLIIMQLSTAFIVGLLVALAISALQETQLLSRRA